MPTPTAIHPERAGVRTTAAVALSIALHGGAIAGLGAASAASAERARRAEAERPTPVALALLDPSAWEANRRVAAEPRPPEPSTSRSAVAMVAPGRRDRPDLPLDGEAAPGGARGDPSEVPPAPATPTPAAGPAPGPTGAAVGLPDLQPRPRPTAPLAMRFDPVGTGGGALGEGTAFSGLTVQTPEAWRYTNFFGRAVEALNAVYRHELGAPMPASLHARWLASPRAGGACSMTEVAVDRSGVLLEARVRRSSGMADLDALIVEVIRRTAPFVNVPTGLLGDGGVYRDTWGLCIAWGRWRG